MIAYAEYFTDARIKSYVESLIKNNVKVILYCLYDNESKGEENKFFSVKYLGKKYQGKNILLYVISYLFFALKAFYSVSYGFFKYRFDVVHVHNIPDFIVFCALTPKLFGRKIILDMHDVMTSTFDIKFSGFSKKVIRSIILLQSKISLLFSSALICVNKSQLKYVEDEGLKCKNTLIILNLPYGKFFSLRKSEPNNEYFRLIYHGTITERLGLDIIVKAVEIASQSIRVKLTLIGEGELKTSLIRYCEERKLLNDIVIFKPFIKVENLQKEIEKHDCGVIGNRKSELTDKIMLPVKMMEYLAVGLPVVAPDLQVIKDHFEEDIVMYYTSDDIAGLAERIILFSKNAELRKEFVNKSKRFFDLYNWDKQEKKYVELIEELAG